MAETIMAEGIPAPESVATVVSQDPKAQPQRGWNYSKEYDATRKDYQIKDEGEYQVSYDPATGKEVRRVLKSVLANATLADKERLQTAKELMETPLAPKQEQGILQAHAIGAGEPGKDKTEAGVYNYTQAQLLQKARILKEAGFNKEQRRHLMEEGLVGAIPEDAFDAVPAYTDPKLNPIFIQIQTIARSGHADETFLARQSARIERLIDDAQQGTLNVTEAQDALARLEEARISAVTQRPDRRVERGSQPPSFFETTIFDIDNLEKQMPPIGDPARIAAEARLDSLRNERDKILQEVHKLGWFNHIKANVFKIYHDSRVEVTYREKTERRMDGRISVLDSLRNEQDIAEHTSWEASAKFWKNTTDLQFQADLIRLGGENNIRGVIDYLERESLKLVTEVVIDRKKYDDPYKAESYPNRGIVDLWDYEYSLPNGEIRQAKDFTDVRDIVEHERKTKPKVPNRGDYESWIALVADNPEEAEEMLPYIVGAVRGKLVGGPQIQNNKLQQEQEKWITAIDYLRTELGYDAGDTKFIRLATMVRQELNLLGIEVFADFVKETWEPFLNSATDIARGFKDTEFQDHTIDVLLLDREGIKLAALEYMALNDWEYFRFGRNTKDTQSSLNYGDALQVQQERRAQIENWLIERELRPMQELLNADVDDNGQVVINGEPQHPAFKRMKDELELIDRNDPRRTVSGFIPRWYEYVQKAIQWQRTGESSNPRDKIQRVIFQHPLARVFHPWGFKNEQGNVTQVDEFWTMFRKIKTQDPNNQKEIARKLAKRTELVKKGLKSAERIVKFSMSDVIAGGPRHFFEVYKDNNTLSSPHGDIVTHAGQNFLRLATGTELKIEFDNNGNPVVNEVEPHIKLVKDLMQKIVEFDGQKPKKRQLMRLHRIMKYKLGIDLPLPGNSDWYLGAHDSNRPHLLKYLQQIPEWNEQLKERQKLRGFDGTEGNDGYGYGADAKTAMARDPEDGRRLLLLAQVYIRNKYGSYFNYPGQDDPEGGVKEFKNIIFQVYGISMGTVEINALIKNAWLGEGGFLSAFGCETWKQFVGRLKGPNEIMYAKTRGFFENPRDAENYFKRFQAIVEEAKIWTSGGEDSHGVLNDGLISGAFNARAIDLNAQTFARTDITPTKMLFDPDAAYQEIDEQAYKSYVETAGRIAAPLAKIMQARLKLENVYGRNPQSAMFLNTLLWYDFLKWMDESPEEFRAKFGFAYNVNLPMARIFIHTFLYESRLIYNDEQWDRIMLGYVIPKDQWETIKNWNGDPRYKPTLNSVVMHNTSLEGVKGINRVDKLIRYKADVDGKVLGYYRRSNPDDNTREQWKYDSRDPNSIIDPKEKSVRDALLRDKNNVENGEVVEGLLDALPKEIREEALKPENRWFPVGIQSYYPETLKALKQRIPDENKRHKKLYKDILKIVEEDDAKHKSDNKYSQRIVRQREEVQRA